MSTPRATYRLQLRGGMTFARAADLAPYLARLGISHVYLSPIFRAVPGSAHGYDTADFNEIDPELGGSDGFAALAGTARANGLKIIIDFVPNHMGASPANPWWRDVLEWGAASRYAQHFDVDWSAPKLIVPALGKPYGEALGSGDLTFRFDAKTGGVSLRYYELELPLTPPSYADVMTKADPAAFAELARRFASSSPETSGQLLADLSEAAVDPSIRRQIDAALADIQSDKIALHDMLEAQVWRLAHWRASRESLTYRRFFEISELVGVRVEQASVFDDVHRTILALVADGLVDGLRIDHIDGVADPLGYLTRLRAAVGEDTYIVVEKILGPGEDVRPEWPVAGTTGYEFIRDIATLLVAEDDGTLKRGYADFIGREADFHAEALAIKRRTITRNLAGELDVLTSQALELARSDIATRDYGADTLRRSIIELASNLSVYRTYVDTAGTKPADAAVLHAAAEAAKASREVEDESAIDLITRFLTLDLETPARQAVALGFATRFQQTTGPLMAKALEDTLFYRFNRLIAANEVGGEPDRLSEPVSVFHDRMRARQNGAPRALTATATHDTKRGEDARARIYTVSECPDTWIAAVNRWSEQLAGYCSEINNERVPEPQIEWLFYQSLLGAWPANSSVTDAHDLEALRDRMVAFMQKAAREAKLRTSWTQPDEAYEAALEQFVVGALDPNRSAGFLCDFAAIAKPIILAGVLNSLSQLVIKLFAPGVPDLYQGTEFWDLSLVDPDNRRQVDYEPRSKALQNHEADIPNLLRSWPDGAIKLLCMQRGLQLLAQVDEPTAEAEYIGLDVQGAMARHVVAFARQYRTHTIIVVAVRLPLCHLQGVTEPHIPSDRWLDTIVLIPPQLRSPRLDNILTQQAVVVSEGQLELCRLLDQFPVAVLAGQHATHD